MGRWRTFRERRRGLSVPAVAALAAVVAGVLAAGPGRLQAAAPDAKAADLVAEPGPPPAGPEGAPGGQTPVDVALKEETFEVARQLVKDFPNDANAIGVMGTMCDGYGNTAEAVTWWQKCLEADPTRADAYHAMATAARRKGEYQRAVELWRKAEAIGPNLPGMYRAYAEVLLETGKPEEAVAAAEKELALNPDSLEAHVLLGKACLGLKESDKAAAHYEKARRIKPDDSRSYYGLATLYARQGQTDKAREYMEQFQKARAEEEKAKREARDEALDSRAWAAKILSKVHTDAGRLYAAHRNPEKAEEHWRRAAAVDPGNRVCRHALVDLYLGTGRDRQALTFSEQLRLIDPKNVTYHLNTGALLVQLQMYDAAEEAVRKGIELAPNNPTGYLSLVRILLFRQQRIPEAKTLAQRLIELEPTASNYALLGEACDRAGDLPGALAAMERAIALEPGNQRFRAVYQRLQQKK